jgi:hypothetical protein
MKLIVNLFLNASEEKGDTVSTLLAQQLARF